MTWPTGRTDLERVHNATEALCYISGADDVEVQLQLQLPTWPPRHRPACEFSCLGGWTALALFVKQTIVHPHDAGHLDEAHDRFQAAGGSFVMRYRLRRADSPIAGYGACAKLGEGGKRRGTKLAFMLPIERYATL